MRTRDEKWIRKHFSVGLMGVWGDYLPWEFDLLTGYFLSVVIFDRVLYNWGYSHKTAASFISEKVKQMA